MSILKIAKIGHPILYQKALLVDKINKDILKSLVFNMSETMLDASGVGLAAPQVHISKRLIIFRAPEDEVNPPSKQTEKNIEITVLINPVYENLTEEFEDDWEGCLSIPGMLGKVRRYKKIKYKGFDLKGNLIKKTVEGDHARIVQHECDHLEGILYTSRLCDKKAFGFVEEINKYMQDEKQK